MGQEFHVLRCFSCHSFQVQQVKKVNRWSCKLCGQKQSVLKEYGRGSGADCRRHVQKLNAMRGAMMEEEEEATWSLWQQASADAEAEEQVDVQVSCAQVSRWNKYLEPPQGAEPEDHKPEHNVVTDRQQLHGNRTNRKRKRSDDRRTPEQQMDCFRPDRTSSRTRTSPPRMNRTSSPSQTRTGLSSMNRTGPPSQTRTSPPSMNRTGPPSQTRTGPPSGSGSGSRWTRFLSAVCPEREELNVGGVNSGSDDVPTLQAPSFGSNTVQQAPPPGRPRPLLPGSSLFNSGDDFSFDDMF